MTKRFGLRAIDKGTGKQIQVIQKAAAVAVREGDPVSLANDGTVAPLLSATKANFFGVVEGVYRKDDQGNPAPLLIGNEEVAITSGVSGWVSVNTDLTQRYECYIHTDISAGNIGNTVDVVALTAGANGRSGYIADASSLGTSSAEPFKIVGISQYDVAANAGNRTTSTNPARIIVVPNKGVFVPETPGI